MSKLSDYTPEEVAEFFGYLDGLRESGKTNMFGARPYLVNKFSMKNDLAGEVLSEWMETFREGSTPLERAKEVDSLGS